MDESRILIERDGPCFGPEGYPRSTSGLLGMAAVEIANVRGQDWKHLLVIASTNPNDSM